MSVVAVLVGARGRLISLLLSLTLTSDGFFVAHGASGATFCRACRLADADGR